MRRAGLTRKPSAGAQDGSTAPTLTTNARLARVVGKIGRAAAANLIAVAGGALVVVFLATYSLGSIFALGPASGAPEATFRAQLDRSVPKILAHFRVPGMVI